MPKETAAGSSKGGLVYLRHTYRYRSQLDEPNDDWLEVIEATNDELLGAYMKVEDEAMSTVFGAQGKRRLNRVFDVIGFIYPDYSFPARKQGAKRKIATTTSSTASKPKRAKVFTHRPKLHSLEKTPVVPATKKMVIVECAESTLLASEIIPFVTVEATVAPVEETDGKSSKTEEHPKLQSPPTTTGLPKLATAATITPRKGRRMASVLDVVLKSSKVPTPASTKTSENKIEELGGAIAESASPACAEAGPSRIKPAEQAEEDLLEKLTSPIPEAFSQDDLGYIVRHASGKRLSEDQIAEVQYYAKYLKYPRGSLVYRGSDEDVFLYCLPDNKDINVCQEIMDNIGYPKLELGVSVMSKDQLAEALLITA
jgi:hypothetical protein